MASDDQIDAYLERLGGKAPEEPVRARKGPLADPVEAYLTMVRNRPPEPPRWQRVGQAALDIAGRPMPPRRTEAPATEFFKPFTEAATGKPRLPELIGGEPGSFRSLVGQALGGLETGLGLLSAPYAGAGRLGEQLIEQVPRLAGQAPVSSTFSRATGEAIPWLMAGGPFARTKPLPQPDINFRFIPRPELPAPPRGALGPSEMKPPPPGPRGVYATYDVGPRPGGLAPPEGPLALPQAATRMPPRGPLTWNDLATEARTFRTVEDFKAWAQSSPSVRKQLREGKITAEKFYADATKLPGEEPPPAAAPVREPKPPKVPPTDAERAAKIAERRTAKEKADLPLFAEQIPETKAADVEASMARHRQAFQATVEKLQRQGDEDRAFVASKVTPEELAALDKRRAALPDSSEYHGNFWSAERKKVSQPAPPAGPVREATSKGPPAPPDVLAPVTMDSLKKRVGPYGIEQIHKAESPEAIDQITKDALAQTPYVSTKMAWDAVHGAPETAKAPPPTFENLVAAAEANVGVKINREDPRWGDLWTAEKVAKDPPVRMEFEHGTVFGTRDEARLYGTKHRARFGRLIGARPLEPTDQLNPTRIMYSFKPSSPARQRFEARQAEKEAARQAKKGEAAGAPPTGQITRAPYYRTSGAGGKLQGWDLIDAADRDVRHAAATMPFEQFAAGVAKDKLAKRVIGTKAGGDVERFWRSVQESVAKDKAAAETRPVPPYTAKDDATSLRQFIKEYGKADPKSPMGERVASAKQRLAELEGQPPLPTEPIPPEVKPPPYVPRSASPIVQAQDRVFVDGFMSGERGEQMTPRQVATKFPTLSDMQIEAFLNGQEDGLKGDRWRLQNMGLEGLLEERRSPDRVPPPAAPRFEQTPAGEQAVIGDLPKREMPTKGITPKGAQAPIEESPLFGQAKAARERAAAEAQGELGGDPQRAAVQEWLADQLGSQAQMSLAKAKSATAIPPATRAKLKSLGITPEEAWDVSHSEVPKKATLDRLVGLSSAAGRELTDAQGDLTGGLPPPPPKRPFFGASQQGFEHGVPSLRDPDDLYQLVKSMGGISDAEVGELADIPTWAKNRNGVTWDRMAEVLADNYPSLGTREEIKENLADGLRTYEVLKEGKKARAAREAAAQAMEQDIISVPPGPGDPDSLRDAINFFRDIGMDEDGKLDLARMRLAWKRFRQKFPMEEAVRKARPNSPVISEVERWSVSMANWMAQRVALPWHKGVRKGNPELMKDAEVLAVNEWKAAGMTPAAELRARRHFSPEVQASMHQRDVLFDQTNRSREYFGLPPVKRNTGPYLPRQAKGESREAVSLEAGGQLGVGRALQTGVGGRGEHRVFETYRDGEAAHIEYEDPRNSILLADWTDFKIRATHQLFQNLERKGTLFRDTSRQAEAAALQAARQRSQALIRSGQPGLTPDQIKQIGEQARNMAVAAIKQRAAAAGTTGQSFAVENAPGGRWWVPTEAEARFLRQNLVESVKGPDASLVAYGNALFRNPNLVIPFPHVLRNMATKLILARGPVGIYTMARDAWEYARITRKKAVPTPAQAKLLSEFKEAMPFSETGQSGGEVLGRELVSGDVTDAIRRATHEFGRLNRPSQIAIFKYADPAMRYSLFKYYRGQGKGIYEAGNHAWTDLIRYGTRSSTVDRWKSWPMNFFVPWRFGTFAALVKQTTNHPVRTALLVGGIDYLREVNYRQRGKWVHLPWDYVEAPIAQIVQSKGAGDLAKNLGSQAALTYLFGPGGAFSASQLDEMLQLAAGRKDPFSQETYARLMNMFWGLQQIYNLPKEYKKGEYGDMLATIMLGEHNALTYQPKRLGPGFGLIPEKVLQELPEWMGMKKSRLVKEAEQYQAERDERRARRRERQAERPTPSIEDKLRASGYLK